MRLRLEIRSCWLQMVATTSAKHPARNLKRRRLRREFDSTSFGSSHGRFKGKKHFYLIHWSSSRKELEAAYGASVQRAHRHCGHTRRPFQPNRRISAAIYSRKCFPATHFTSRFRLLSAIQNGSCRSTVQRIRGSGFWECIQHACARARVRLRLYVDF